MLVRKCHPDGIERLDREGQGGASGSCRRRAHSVDSDVDVQKGKKFSGRSVNHKSERLHQARTMIWSA